MFHPSCQLLWNYDTISDNNTVDAAGFIFPKDAEKTVRLIMKRRLLSLSLSLALSALVLSALFPPHASADPQAPRFADVRAEDWFAPYINSLAERGAVNGYPDGSFRPGGNATWGETLKLVLLCSDFPEQKYREEEEEERHWAEGYLSFALRHELLPEEPEVNLDQPVSRYDVASLCAASLDLDTEMPPEEHPFSDTDDLNVLVLYQVGIMVGDFSSDGLRVFRGEEPLSRAELCTLLVRLVSYVDDNFVTVSGLRAAINRELRASPYDASSFSWGEDGRVTYTAESPTTRFGIDVSYYQQDIDWNRVAEDGVQFAIIRCGFRGYGSMGPITEDARFREYIEGALAAGLDVGVYFFSQAVSVEEALEEARFTLDLIRDYPITYPVVFDWEQVSSLGARTRDPDWEVVGDCAVAFCEAVAAEGYTPMTYFNKYMAYITLDMEKYQRYDGWLALYQEEQDYIYDFQMWQYSSQGIVSGISQRVDLNICFKDFAAS